MGSATWRIVASAAHAPASRRYDGCIAQSQHRIVIEQAFAAVAFVVCALLFARLFVGERRRRRFDAAVLRRFAAWRHRALALWRWRAARREARRVADEAIRRARERGRRGNGSAAADDDERDGNVYRPKSFRGPRKPH
jgi:hypothetical protein